MIITSQHRNERLALRHLRELKKEYAYAEITARRNARGQFSKRGQVFEFEVEKKKKGKKTEYVLHFDYGNAKAQNLIRFQVHIIGPATRNDARVIEIVRAVEKDGEEALPRGWTIKQIYWGHPTEESDGEEVERTYDDDPKLEGVKGYAIKNGDAKVIARKNSVQPNRSSRKGVKPR